MNDYNFLENVKVEDIKNYLYGLGFEEIALAVKRSDFIGPMVRMRAYVDGHDFDIEMGEALPRKFKEGQIIEDTEFGPIIANYWDHDYGAVFQYNEKDQLPTIPEYISKWWKLIASKNLDTNKIYFDKIEKTYKKILKNNELTIIKSEIEKIKRELGKSQEQKTQLNKE